MNETQMMQQIAQDPTLHTDLAHLIRVWPQLHSRAIKAAWLYVNNHVEQQPDGNYHIQGTHNIQVIFRNDIRCVCPDVQFNIAPQGPLNKPWCKHMIAVVFHYRYQEQQKETS